MENPATWGPEERVIRQVLSGWHANNALPPGERRIGLSLERQITEALREAGLLADHDREDLDVTRADLGAAPVAADDQACH